MGNSHNQPGMKVAKAYDGVLALGVTISTTTKLEPKFLKVKMYQGTNVVEPYYTNLNHAARRKMKVNSAAAGASSWSMSGMISTISILTSRSSIPSGPWSLL